MSNLFRLDLKDLLKGLVVVVLSAALATVLEALNNGVDWKVVGITALSAGLSYILKNLATDNEGKILGKL